MNNLETERLVLRNWQDGDAEELFLAAKNPNVGPMCGWDPHKDVSESLFSIRNILNSENCFALVLKETGKPVGSIELMTGEKSRLSASDSEAELGYWLAVPWWGKGIMTEAVRAICREAFRAFDIVRIYAEPFARNTGSCRVLEKEVDSEKVCEIYRRAGIRKWSNLLYAFLKEQLGLTDEFVCCKSVGYNSLPLSEIVWRGGNFGWHSEERVCSSQKKWKRKLQTFLFFLQNVKFSCKFVIRESFWTIMDLVRGQMR